MRVIALDYGRARTGVAISDPTGTLARPLGVVERVRHAGRDGRADPPDRRRRGGAGRGRPAADAGRRDRAPRRPRRWTSCASCASAAARRSRPRTSGSPRRWPAPRSAPAGRTTRSPPRTCSRGTCDGSPDSRDRGPGGRRAAGVWFGVKALFPDSSKPAADPHGAGDRGQDPGGHRRGGDRRRILEDAGVVDDGGRFRNYAKDQGEGAEFKAGTYRFRAGTDYDVIIAQLDKGPVAAPVSKLVIPEGYRTTEIADRVTTVGHEPGRLPGRRHRRAVPGRVRPPTRSTRASCSRRPTTSKRNERPSELVSRADGGVRGRLLAGRHDATRSRRT